MLRAHEHTLTTNTRRKESIWDKVDKRKIKEKETKRKMNNQTHGTRLHNEAPCQRRRNVLQCSETAAETSTTHGVSRISFIPWNKNEFDGALLPCDDEEGAQWNTWLMKLGGLGSIPMLSQYRRSALMKGNPRTTVETVEYGALAICGRWCPIRKLLKAPLRHEAPNLTTV
jgi:hypothetical protein